MTPFVSVILPCQNERESIKRCIEEIYAVARAHDIHVEVIVSDSSTDGSDKLAEEEGARLVKHDKDGYGFAIREGVRHAEGDIVIYADADGTYDFSDIPKLIHELAHADIAIGSRLQGNIEKGAMPLPHRLLGTPLFNLLLRIFLNINVSDSQSGFRALTKETFNDLDLKTHGMEFATEMIIKAKKKKKKIKEIPSNYFQRGGTSKLRRYRDGWAHLKYIMTQTPLTFYAATGGAISLFGLASLFLAHFTDIVLPSFINSATAKILFPLLGTQIIFFGLFAKTLLYIKYREEDSHIRKITSNLNIKITLIFASLLVLVPALLKITENADQLFELLFVLVILGIQIIFNATLLFILNPFTSHSAEQ